MSRTLQAVLNESNPNKVALAGQQMKMGDALSMGLAVFVTGSVSSNRLVLPEGRKAAAVIACYVRAGGVTGYFTPVAPTAVLATTQVTIYPNGDLEFLGADAVTSVEVVYVPVDGTIYEESVPVAANVGTFLQSKRARTILSVTATAGGSTGAKTLLDRAAAPAAGQASLRLDGTGVTFAGADAVTQATIRYIATPGVGVAPDSIAERLDTEIAL